MRLMTKWVKTTFCLFCFAKRAFSFMIREIRGNKMASPRLRRKHAPNAKEVNALLEISKAIASGLYLEDVLRLIVTVTANVMDSKICSLWILDEKDQKLKLKATQSISEEYLKERSLGDGRRGRGGTSPFTTVPMAILDVLKDPLYKEKDLARREGLVSMLSVPMCIKNRVIGVINCYTSYPHSFSKIEEEMLTTVANQAAICIENSGLMETLDIDEILQARPGGGDQKYRLRPGPALSGERKEAYPRMQDGRGDRRGEDQGDRSAPGP